MHLDDFIISNLEAILVEWETFARSIDAGEHLEWAALRDHAGLILQATAKDMKSPQTSVEQTLKAKGLEAPSESDALDDASDAHAIERLNQGFNMMEMMSEYRALRASVLRLWDNSDPAPNSRDINDVTRFNESIDQSLTTAIASYAKRVDQARDTFLAILGHDLRNPLSAISMAASLIPHVRLDEEETIEFCSLISSSASSMERMINDLLDFTRTRLGAGMPIKRAPVDLGKLCGEIIAECNVAHPSRKVVFTCEGNLEANLDSDRIRQAISNLMGNSIQHGTHEAPVTLSLRGDQSSLTIEVHNGGTPIPQNELLTIFEPLVQGSSDEGRQDVRNGSIGMGLYIAREVAESHGGRIDAKSTSVDGTVFTIRLPRDVENNFVKVRQAD